MTRPPTIRAFLGDEVIADNFAGGGGASLGIELALGRSPDLAVNHDDEAIAMHAANHPTTTHYTESVWEVDPRAACAGRPVALAWFSPDCKHHSKAKGGKPREQKIRGLAWVAVTWAHRVRPRVIALENVEEFREWGPLHRQHTNGCKGEFVRERRINGRSRETQGCRSACILGKPIASRRGETFRAFVRKLERLGYVVEYRLLRACDYGAPTTRRRLFLIARCDGRPIRWPAPTHGPIGTGRPSLHRTAAEIIDWSIPCPSIFDRERPLADKTLARIARGIRKFVLENPRPFVIPVNHGGVGRRDHRVHDLGQPMPTVTGGQRGGHALVTPYLASYYGGERGETRGRALDEPVPTQTTERRFALVAPVVTKFQQHGAGQDAREPLHTVMAGAGRFAIAVPYLVHRSNGERPGQAPRIYDPERPLGTVVAQGNKHALCAAFLAKHYGDRPSGGWNGGSAADRPIDTITVRDHHALVATQLRALGVTGPVVADEERGDLGELPAAGGDGRSRLVERRAGARPVELREVPLGTLTTKPRFGLVTVTIDGEEYVVVDIGMRMLTPRELFRAQGFGDDYEIEPIGPNGKPLTKTAQIRMCGNSVAPPVAAAIVRANLLEAA